MSEINGIAKEIVKTIREDKNKGTKPYDTQATVMRVEDGTAWVRIPGGVDETPAQLTMDAKEGDNVQVRVSGGRAWLAGNGTSPPTDDTKATEANETAKSANIAARAAFNAADAAQTDAARAHDAADKAEASAATAESQATRATTYANSALSQLGTVEDVVGVLNWMQTHGKYKPTSDQAVIDDKAYWSLTTVATPASNPRERGYFERKEITDEGTTSYIYEPTLDSTVTTGKTYYTISRVEEVAEDANPYDLGYLELADINEAVSDYINARLALTDKGLYVVGGDTENEGYKILLASDGMTVYDAQGNAVSKFGESIEFSSTRPQYIGGETAYIVFNPEDGTINAGGEGFRFNNNMTLSEMLAEVGKVGGLEDDTNGLLQKTSSISYENNSLVISGGDSSTVKLVIGSDRISFYDGDNEVAYISNNQMCIPRSIVLDSLDMGDNKWRWTLNTDDHLTLQWIGG